MEKACFFHDSAYTDSKDLATRTVADKILKNRADKIKLNSKYDWYQKGISKTSV